jgi:hypothetical protein
VQLGDGVFGMRKTITKAFGLDDATRSYEWQLRLGTDKGPRRPNPFNWLDVFDATCGTLRIAGT